MGIWYETLARLGYAGIGYTGVTDLAARQAAFRAKGLKIFNLYVAVFVDRPVAYDPELPAAWPQLAGSGTVVWLTVQGRSPNDERAVALVRELADAAAGQTPNRKSQSRASRPQPDILREKRLESPTVIIFPS
jgi:hypothetical protein